MCSIKRTESACLSLYENHKKTKMQKYKMQNTYFHSTSGKRRAQCACVALLSGAQIPRGRRTYLNPFNNTLFVSLLYLTVQGAQKICQTWWRASCQLAQLLAARASWPLSAPTGRCQLANSPAPQPTIFRIFCSGSCAPLLSTWRLGPAGRCLASIGQQTARGPPPFCPRKVPKSTFTRDHKVHKIFVNQINICR